MTKVVLISNDKNKASILEQAAKKVGFLTPYIENVILNTNSQVAPRLQLISRLKGKFNENVKLVYDPAAIPSREVIQAWILAGGSKRVEFENAKDIGWL